MLNENIDDEGEALERERRQPKYPTLLVVPHRTTHQVWEFVINMTTIISMIFVPYELVFENDLNGLEPFSAYRVLSIAPSSNRLLYACRNGMEDDWL